MATIIGKNIYIDVEGTYVKHNPEPVSLTIKNYDISDIKSTGDVVNVKETKVYDDATESEFSNIETFTLDFRVVLSPSDTSLDSLYWPDVHKSSDWPLFNLSKPYFVFYSPDHGTADGGGVKIGEMDDPEFTNFIELGTIVTGPQAETPHLIKVPTSVSGLASDTYFLYYHIDNTTVDGTQETKLVTTSGGDAPHLCTWTDQGFPLGLSGDDDHTGYCRVWERAGRYIAHHLSKSSGGVPGSGHSSISESTTALNFNRVKQIDQTSGMPIGDNFYFIQMCQFVYNEINFAFVIQKTPTDNFISICEVDNDLMPVTLIKKIVKGVDLRTLNLYENGVTAYLYHKKGIDNQDNLHPYQIFKFDLSELDSYVSIYSQYEPEVASYLQHSGATNTDILYAPTTPQENEGQVIYQALDTFLKTLDTLQIKSKFKAIYPFIGNEKTHKFNILNIEDTDEAFRLDFVGDWVHSPTGIKPDGATTYALTHFTPSNHFDSELNHVSFYSREDTPAHQSIDIGASTGVGQRLRISAKDANGNYTAENLGAETSETINNDSRGFYLVTKQSETIGKAFKNGIEIDSFDSSGTLPTAPITIASYSNATTEAIGSRLSDREFAIITIGAELTDQEQLDLYNAVQNLQIALKREV